MKRDLGCINAMTFIIYCGQAALFPSILAIQPAKSPLGPWKYGGVLMPTEGRSFTNHPGIVDYKGNTYLFYHSGRFPEVPVSHAQYV